MDPMSKDVIMREDACLTVPSEENPSLIRWLSEYLARPELPVQYYPETDFGPQDVPAGHEAVQRCNLSLQVQVVFEIRAEEDGEEFHGWIPGLEGLHVAGRTMDEVMTNACHAFAAYANSLQCHKQSLPRTPHFRVETQQRFATEGTIAKSLIGP